MVIQSQKTGRVWKTPFRKSGHKYTCILVMGEGVVKVCQIEGKNLVSLGLTIAHGNSNTANQARTQLIPYHVFVVCTLIIIIINYMQSSFYT